LIASLRFEKPIRWNASNVTFSRPIRWLLAIYGAGEACQVVPFEYASLRSSNITRGLRFHDPEKFQVSSPAQYFAFLKEQGILLDVAERRAVIQKQVHQLAQQVGGSIAEDDALLAEVANLVEAPTGLRGSFDPAHLKLPREVLIAVMKKHQRYFPVLSSPDKGTYLESESPLLPYFITVRNGDGQFLDIVTDGNEHVIRARFADADFFVREDIKQPLAAYVPRLGTLTFQTRLGSMLDKVYRIVALVVDLAQQVGLTPDEKEVACRAAELCKADLTTNMVVEMTSLQGLMGRYYALRSGEPPSVAQAIFEHYLPRYTGDLSPASRPGLVVGLADRLDSLAGLFSADLAPSGNRDPFAQRRTALGLVQNLITWDLDFDLQRAFRSAAAHLPIPASPESQQAAMEFIVERLRNTLLDQGHRYDVVEAVLAAQGHNPARAARAVRALEVWVARPDWHAILPAYARCVRITRDFEERFEVDPAFFVTPEEGELFAALVSAEAAPRPAGSVDGFLNAFLPMIPVINHFFDTVLVMAEETRLRQNRLAMLQRISALADGVADMSRLEGF
jgi:glycyl-tRNA synthetase